MTDEQALALQYITQHPGENTEDVCNWFAPADGDDYRGVIAAAVEALVMEGLVIRDDRRGGALFERKAALK